ncbi:MAG: HEAT repeat domain-containing protein [Planctomycetota bacterium]|nr:HEAT repeat domain-containing protein [Planctomycetota bacterium]
MSKLSMAICLSLSIVSLGMAGFALLQSTPGDGSSRSDEELGNTSVEAIQEIRELASNLRGTEEELRLRVEKLESLAARSLKGGKKGKAGAGDGAGDPDLAADIAALAERLEILESDENIAELARSGFARARKKETEDAFSLVLDTSQPARERLRAWQSLRKGGGKGKGQSGPPEALQSIIDLARDTTLGPELREEAVKSLRGERSEEVKEPMLNILAEDDDPQVRRRSLEVLMWHGGDPAVLETITAISREDRHEGVQQHAAAILPKVQHFSREAEAGAARGGDSK